MVMVMVMVVVVMVVVVVVEVCCLTAAMEVEASVDFLARTS